MSTTPGLNITEYVAKQVSPDITINLIANIIEAGAVGVLVHDMALDADYTLATTGTEPFEWQNGVIWITDTGVVLTGGVNIVLPDYVRSYIVCNATAQTLTFKNIGSGVAVASNTSQLVYSDGSQVTAMPNFA